MQAESQLVAGYRRPDGFIGARRRGRGAGPGAARVLRRRTLHSPRPLPRFASSAPRSSKPIAAICRRRAQRALSDAMLDRLALDEKRVAAMASGIEDIAALTDPDRRRHRSLDAAQRPAHRARARAARRHRHHLREPSERHRRCRRAVPEIRQRGDSARRLGERELEPRHSRMPGRRLARRRLARDRDPDRADDRSRRGGPHALGHDRLHRRRRAARRAQSGRARAEGSARAGHRTSRGQLPRLRRPRCGCRAWRARSC